MEDEGLAVLPAQWSVKALHISIVDYGTVVQKTSDATNPHPPSRMPAPGRMPTVSALIYVQISEISTIIFIDDAWDPYPYILLNLGLSMLAGLQGAILLIVAKRQDGISAAMALHDFQTDTAAKQEIDRLIQLSEQQLVIILELRTHFRGDHVPEPAVDLQYPVQGGPAQEKLL